MVSIRLSIGLTRNTTWAEVAGGREGAARENMFTTYTMVVNMITMMMMMVTWCCLRTEYSATSPMGPVSALSQIKVLDPGNESRSSSSSSLATSLMSPRLTLPPLSSD